MTDPCVLVTGASGFVGRALTAELLERNVGDVHSLSRGTLDIGSTHHRCDLMDREGTEALLGELRPTLLIHSAWYAEHGKFWSAEQNLDWIGASLDLMRAFHQSGGERFVGVGTCAEYGWGGNQKLVEGESALEPATLYGVAKDATRRVIQSYAETHGVEWAWARLFMMYGVGEPPARLTPSIVLPLLRGERATCSAGEQLRDFLHVKDVACGIVCLALSEASGPLNVASGEGLSVADFATELARATDHPELLDLGARPMRPGDPESIVADTTLLRVLGFEPSFDLCSGVQDVVNELRSNTRSGTHLLDS